MYFNITSQSNKFLIKFISLGNFCKHKNIFPKKQNNPEAFERA